MVLFEIDRPLSSYNRLQLIKTTTKKFPFLVQLGRDSWLHAFSQPSHEVPICLTSLSSRHFYIVSLFILSLCLFCSQPTVNDGGIQLTEVGLGRRRQSRAAVSNGYIHQRLHHVWHSGKCHFRPLCFEPHVAVWQHSLRSAQINGQTNSALYIPGKEKMVLWFYLIFFENDNRHNIIYLRFHYISLFRIN